MKTKRNRAISLLVCVAVCLVLFFSFSYISQESDHNCPHHHCKTCIKLDNSISFIKGLSFGEGFIWVLAIVSVIAVSLRPLISHDRLCTPVSLKVKMIN